VPVVEDDDDEEEDDGDELPLDALA